MVFNRLFGSIVIILHLDGEDSLGTGLQREAVATDIEYTLRQHNRIEAGRSHLIIEGYHYLGAILSLVIRIDYLVVDSRGHHIAHHVHHFDFAKVAVSNTAGMTEREGAELLNGHSYDGSGHGDLGQTEVGLYIDGEEGVFLFAIVALEEFAIHILGLDAHHERVVLGEHIVGNQDSGGGVVVAHLYLARLGHAKA